MRGLKTGMRIFLTLAGEGSSRPDERPRYPLTPPPLGC
jgi:hypothetical protein